MSRSRLIELPWTFLGRRPYNEVWKIQEELRMEVLQGKSPGQLLIVEHPPTISMGRGEKGNNLRMNQDWLQSQGFDVVQTNRGGLVTYHGPGQLVAYPIVDLRELKKGVRAYVAGLELTMIDCLKTYDISAQRRSEFIGVWVGNKKIGSIGIHVRKQVSIHGLALNVAPNLQHFDVITPCGIPDVRMTSMEQEGVSLTLEDLLPAFLKSFSQSFGCKLKKRG